MESTKVFAKAEGVRTKLSVQQEKAIAKMYKDLAKDIDKEAKALSTRTNISSVMRASYLKDLKGQISSQLASYSSDQKSMIKDNMLQVAQAVVADNSKYLSSIGLNVSGAFSYVPKDVVEQLASGKLYEGKWTLSKAIWGNDKKILSDIDMVIAKGVAGQKSTYEIAKDLEKYVDPSKAKPWNWGKVYPGSAKKIDYNAQRLARTMVSHAYQESFVRTTKKNPFIEAYRWLSSEDDRVCPLCIERAEGVHGVVINGEEILGAYYKSDLPMDHPNGRCTFDIISGTSDEEDNARLASWIKGGDDEELDDYARSTGYNPDIVKGTLGTASIVTPEKLKESLENYVGGGYSSVKSALSEQELQYVKNNMKDYGSSMFRVEESRFTANGLGKGDTFAFKDEVRSFSRSKDYIESVVASGDVFDEPVLFKTVGTTKQFNMDNYASNYYENQSESLVGGKFKVLSVGEEVIDGKEIKLIRIMQLGK